MSPRASIAVRDGAWQVVGYLWPAAVVVAVGFSFTAYSCGAFLWSFALGAVPLTLAVWAAVVRLIPATRGSLSARMQLAAVCLSPLLLLGYRAFGLLAYLPSTLVPLSPALAVGGCVGLSAYFWGLERLRGFPEWLSKQSGGSVAVSLVWLMSGVWFVALFAMTVRHWLNLDQLTQDMAIYEQALYNSWHGHFLEYTLDLRFPGIGFSRLGDHFEPIMLVFLPLYRVWASPVWLLLAQAAALALGAPAVARMTRQWYGSAFAALAFAFAYLMFPGFYAALISEFHAVVLAVPCLLWGVCFGLERRWTASAACLVLAMGCKESLPATVFLIGLYLAWRSDRRFGLAVSGVALVWLWVAVHVIIPHFSPTGSYLYTDMLAEPTRQALLAGDWSRVGWYLMKRCDHLLYLGGTVGELCFLAPATLALSGADIALQAVSGYVAFTLVMGHYQTTVCLGFILGGIKGLAWLRNRLATGSAERRRRVSQALVLGFAGMTVTFALHTSSPLSCFRWDWFRPPASDVREELRLLARVPEGAPVLTNSPAVASHLARRRLIILGDLSKHLTALTGPPGARVDFVALTSYSGGNDGLDPRIRRLLTLVGHSGDVWLWAVKPAAQAAPPPLGPQPGRTSGGVRRSG